MNVKHLILLVLLAGCAQAPTGLHAAHVHDADLVEEIAANPSLIPPPLERDEPAVVKVHMTAKEVTADVASNVTYHYWTFNETVPGPMLRVREGDTVEVTLENAEDSQVFHSIDLHAVTGPGGGAVVQVAPGQEKTFRFKALNPGLYVYHCATPKVAQHMAKGMYGLILVEPEEGLPAVDREFYVMQGELFGGVHDGELVFSPESMRDERPKYVVFNGRPEALHDTPLAARTNETVRLFVGNGGVALSSAFHVIGEIFDTVYPEAASEPVHNVQTTLVPPGGASIVEFDTEVPGNFILVDHALARLEKGASGVLSVSGEENPDIFAVIE